MTERPRIAFFGTPEFAVPALEALHGEAEIVVVVTQPDRRAGRGRKLVSPPVKTAALRLGLHVVQPETIKGSTFACELEAHAPDFIVTAAFGRLLGPKLLALPRRDCLNVHASLLPRHRGAAPVNWAILAGDKETGISIMRMEEGLDTGPVFRAARMPIAPEEDAGALLARLAVLGARVLVEVVREHASLEPVAQDHGQATWAPRLTKSDGAIDWSRDAVDLANHVRGMSPWPTAHTRHEGEVVRVHAARHAAAVLEESAIPGTIIALGSSGIDVACGSGVLRLIELQAEGKRRLGAAEYLLGARLESGDRFGD